ncbi:hypothetical protein BGW38_008607 [Lunasporangiospora selenospora]|uniref:FAD-binding domain-containing protein n=1 Tax=Lunasporangiospora selenospora TaxID=979761 RepID=A0A9P6FZV5_9FUNG|nr:hypothetical protein BGW38_008607 [Lunasporangiospora selenospora]
MADQYLPCRKKPTNARVLIVGAGIGGLMLGALLERAGIEFAIFERAREVKPLGSALSLGANVMPLFEQLGILDEVLAHAKPFGFSTGYNERREATRTLDYSPAQKIKIFMSKKVLSFLQNKDGVMIRCSDNTTYHGELLVGADGAYSGVRQTLYKQMAERGELPRGDDADLPFNSVCLVGQTRPMDPEQFPHLKDDYTWFETTIGENKPYAWVTFTTRSNTICWMVLRHLDDQVSRELDSSFRNSEWGPESAEQMCREVRDFPVPRGTLTIGDLIDATPAEYISKVMLEEKMFETWYNGRTCLIGDGAVSAIQDAVTLANCIYELPDSPSVEEIQQAYQHYRNERFPLARTAYNTSHRLASIVEQAIFTRSLHVMYAYRPQASFLPQVPDLGQYKPAPQPSLARARQRRAVDAVEAAIAAEAAAEAAAQAAVHAQAQESFNDNFMEIRGEKPYLRRPRTASNSSSSRAAKDSSYPARVI